MKSETNALRIGIAVGRGTGPELAEIFARVVLHFASFYSIPIQFHHSSKIYHSYLSLLSSGDGPTNVLSETMKDAVHYTQFCEHEAANGTRVIFRTAITAQSLYLVRQNLEAVKIEQFRHGSASLLLIRDQAQGFYTGSNDYDQEKEIVSRTCHFSKELTSRIISYSLNRAREIWGKQTPIRSVTMVYKHHLFDGILDLWAKEWSEEYGLKIEFVQPDTMNRNLLAFGLRENRLLIASSEYADTMQVILLDMFNQGVQETSYAENVYLHPRMHGLSEYQTVHGSADDLVGKGVVNPTATIKAAIAILARHGSCIGLEEATDRTLQNMLHQKIVTVDQGGDMSTAAFVDAVIQNLDKILSATAKMTDTMTNRTTSGTVNCVPNGAPNSINTHRPPPTCAPPDLTRVSMGKKTALLVMDFQNDFVTPPSLIPPTKPPTPSPLITLAPKLARLISLFRTHAHEVIFIRFLGSPSYQPPPMLHRNLVFNRPAQCLENTPGADFVAPVQPIADERVFDKKAVFDPFLCEGFEAYLRERGIEHLVLCGLYGDVCVDTAARTAFQKGWWVSVVKDCVGMSPLGVKVEAWLEMAKRIYGARVVDLEEVVEMGS